MAKSLITIKQNSSTNLTDEELIATYESNNRQFNMLSNAKAEINYELIQYKANPNKRIELIKSINLIEAQMRRNHYLMLKVEELALKNQALRARILTLKASEKNTRFFSINYRTE